MPSGIPADDLEKKPIWNPDHYQMQTCEKLCDILSKMRVVFTQCSYIFKRFQRLILHACKNFPC